LALSRHSLGLPGIIATLLSAWGRDNCRVDSPAAHAFKGQHTQFLYDGMTFKAEYPREFPTLSACGANKGIIGHLKNEHAVSTHIFLRCSK
jgi:hypothetical protein